MGKECVDAPTVLVVDDEAEIVEVLRAYLEQERFRVCSAPDGPGALRILESQPSTDLVILDLMLPGLDGREVLRRIRRRSDVPVIMLTARGDEIDKLLGLELGADDYVTKPFSPREVVARVRAVLRRSKGGTQGGPSTPAPVPNGHPAQGETYRVGDLQIDVTAHQCRFGERELDLTPTEFKILSALSRSPGRVFTRLQLVEQVQGFAFEGYERTIDAHIKNLRQKLGDDPRQPRYIATVYGVGYKLLGEGGVGQP